MKTKTHSRGKSSSRSVFYRRIQSECPGSGCGYPRLHSLTKSSCLILSPKPYLRPKHPEVRIGRGAVPYHLKKLFLCLIFLIPLFLTPSAAYSVIPSAQAKNPVAAQISPANPSSVAAYITKEAKRYGVNPIDARWIVSHESQFGRNMRGDDGQSRGYWMISSKYHPEVSTACADDLACSTAWSLSWILAGHIGQWSTWKYRFAWYANQNPPL